jgi:hypothetical protein
VEDKAGHSILYAEVDGLNLDQSGGKFSDKARYQAIWISDSSGMGSGGYKIFTEADGSKVFAKYEDTEQTGPVTKGKFEFIGGTGKYTGIKGDGAYTFTTGTDTVAWDVLEGQYEMQK